MWREDIGSSSKQWKSVKLRTAMETTARDASDATQTVDLPAFGWSLLIYDY